MYMSIYIYLSLSLSLSLSLPFVDSPLLKFNSSLNLPFDKRTLEPRQLVSGIPAHVPTPGLGSRRSRRKGHRGLGHIGALPQEWMEDSRAILRIDIVKILYTYLSNNMYVYYVYMYMFMYIFVCMYIYMYRHAFET